MTYTSGNKQLASSYFESEAAITASLDASKSITETSRDKSPNSLKHNYSSNMQTRKESILLRISESCELAADKQRNETSENPQTSAFVKL